VQDDIGGSANCVASRRVKSTATPGALDYMKEKEGCSIRVGEVPAWACFHATAVRYRGLLARMQLVGELHVWQLGLTLRIGEGTRRGMIDGAGGARWCE
jgi:hypothetical protein